MSENLVILYTQGCDSFHTWESGGPDVVALVNVWWPTRGSVRSYAGVVDTTRIWWRPQSTQSAGPVRFLIFYSISIILLASLVAGRRPLYNAGAD